VAAAGKIVALASSGRQVTAGVQVYPPAASDPVSPTPAGGDIYYNTALDELMVYDGTRSKWLSSATYTIQVGRDANTTPGAFFRGIGSMLLDASNRGIACPKGTIVSLAISRTNAGAATLDVLNNGVSVATLANSVSGATRSDTVNADVSAGLLSFQNQAGGSLVANVQIVLQMKRRV
jgi:hypothetical protein